PTGDIVTCGGTQDYDNIYLGTAELYSAAMNTWTKLPDMSRAREGHIAVTVTINGAAKVLVAAGYNDNDGYLLSSEIFDPANNTWTAGPNMLAAENGFARWSPSATVLNDGTVLVAGGYNDNCSPNCGGVMLVERYLKSSEIYDPATNSWSNVGSLSQER